MDVYDGGSGIDTLRLVLTRDEWMSATFQADVARMLVFIAAGTNPNNDKASIREFAFTAFDYTVTDADGDVATQTVTVTITGSNDGPIAVADVAAGTENASVTVDVLANDTDVDDGHVFTLVSAAVPADKGSTSIVDNRLVFTPGAHFDHLALGAIEVVELLWRLCPLQTHLRQDRAPRTTPAISEQTATKSIHPDRPAGRADGDF